MSGERMALDGDRFMLSELDWGGGVNRGGMAWVSALYVNRM